MARKDDIEPPPPPAGVASILKGVAGALAAVVKAHADLAAAAPVEAHETDTAMRRVTLIARAALTLQQLQAAEDKAQERAIERHARRLAAVHAFPPPNLEGDETHMHERDPRLDTPEGVAEIYEGARQCVASLVERLELKRADGPCGGGSPSAGAVRPPAELAGERAPEPTPA